MYITIDVGGTYTRIGVAKNPNKITNKIKFSTEKKYKNAINSIFENIQKLSENNKIDAIGVGTPGVLNEKKDKIILAPNLYDWQNMPIVKDLSRKYNCKVLLENDTALGGLGEAVYGGGKNSKIIAYIAIGTGVGGCRIVNKQIDESSYGFEPGHMILNPDGPVWKGCGQNGCLESYVSGTALYKKYGIIKCEECKDKKIWIEVAKYLGQGIINIITLWSPDCIIVGGGVTKAEDNLFNPLIKFVDKNLKIFKTPIIKPSELKDNSNMYGALWQISK